MLMASEVAKYLIECIVLYGDIPCVIEHKKSKKHDALLDPVNNIFILSVGKYGSEHVDTCVLFTNSNLENKW